MGEPNDVLTQREREVAALAATGVTTKSLARRLGLSTKTIEFHLTNVFRKVGVQSRAELAARWPTLSRVLDEHLPDLGDHTPFIGRATVTDTLVRALLSPAPAPQLIVGGAGIGKTRLADEVTSRLGERGVRSVRIGCAEHSAMTFDPLTHLVQRVLAATPGCLALADDELRSWADDAATSSESIGSERGGLELVALRLGRVLDAAVATGPCLVVADDVHWWTDELLAVLGHALLRSRPGGLAVLLTARPDSDEPVVRPVTRVQQYARMSVTEVAPLTLTDLRRLVETHVVTAGLPPGIQAGLARTIHERSGGIPLFAIDLLDQDAHRWRSLGLTDLGPPTVPPTSAVPLVGRLRGLLDDELFAVRCAAAVGDTFDAHVVGAAISLTTDTAAARLDRAAALGIVRRSYIASTSFTFCHALMRDAVLAECGTEVRQALHADLARTLQCADPSAWAEVARHASLAGSALAAVDALDWCSTAAARSTARRRHTDALVFTRGALDAIRRLEPVDHAAAAGLAIRAARSAALASRPDVMVESAQIAVRHARSAGRHDLVLDAVRAGTQLPTLAQNDPRFDTLLDDIGFDELSPDQLNQLAALRLRWRVTSGGSVTGPFDDDGRLTDVGAVAARAGGDPVGEADWLLALAWAAGCTPDVEFLGRVAGELVDRCAGDSELASRRGIAAALHAWGALVAGDHEACIERWGTLRELAYESGLAQQLAVLPLRFALLELAAGRLGRARSLLADAPGPWQPAPDGWSLIELTQLLLDRAADLPISGAVQRLMEGPLAPLLPVLSAWAALNDGDDRTARAELGRLVERRVPRTDDLAVRWNIYQLAELSFELGDERLAHAVLPDARRHRSLSATFVTMHSLGPMTAAVGLLAATVGRHAESDEAFGDALDWCRRADAPGWSAETMAWWAAARRRRDPADPTARQLAEEARAIALSLGLAKVVRQVAGW